MKDEIEKIMRKGLKTKLCSLRQTHYITDKSLDDKVTKILQLVNNKIDSAEDEIVRCLINAKDTPRWGCQYVAKDILSIIKQKIKE
jgi:hypothetical protein